MLFITYLKIFFVVCLLLVIIKLILGKSDKEYNAENIKKIFSDYIKSKEKTERNEEILIPVKKYFENNYDVFYFDDKKEINKGSHKLTIKFDIYIPDLDIGLDFRGYDLYNFPNEIDNTYEEYLEKRKNTVKKTDICDKYGIYLIFVPYTITTENLNKHLNKLLVNYKNDIIRR